MSPSDDAIALQVLGRIQELRNELEHLRDRADVGKVMDAFVDLTE